MSQDNFRPQIFLNYVWFGVYKDSCLIHSCAVLCVCVWFQPQSLWMEPWVSLSKNSTHASLLISWVIWEESSWSVSLGWQGLLMWEIQLFSWDSMKQKFCVCVNNSSWLFTFSQKLLLVCIQIKDLFSQMLRIKNKERDRNNGVYLVMLRETRGVILVCLEQ